MTPDAKAPTNPTAIPGHDTSLMYAIGRVNQGIRRQMRDTLAAWKLSVQEYTALSVLSARPGLSNAQLARRALVTPQSMIEILTKLENRGLVARAADPRHGLILRAELTPDGIQLLNEADPAVHAIQGRVFDGMTAGDQAAISRALAAAMANLSAAQKPES